MRGSWQEQHTSDIWSNPLMSQKETDVGGPFLS